MRVARGNIYLSSALCALFFPHAPCVALIEREGHVLIVPLIEQSAGGLLLKLRNRAGDRVIHAQEFLRQRSDLGEFDEHIVKVRWSQEWSALVLVDLPARL
ncbi:MAG: hypothetical protein ABSF50_17465 [Burkholderiaceae bacterium]